MGTSYGILPLLNALSVVRLDVVFTPTNRLEQQAWLGAAVRNRFLFACESVKITDGKTLREAFDCCPLPEGHILYKQFSAGFPKAFVWDVSRARPRLKGFTMESDTDYTLSLYVFGAGISWLEEIKQAVRHMMELGLGHPPVPLLLQDMVVHEPLSLEHFAKRCYDAPVTMTIKTRTPLSLLKNGIDSSGGYQSKMNGFPSFYQLVKASVSRLSTLNILYAEDKQRWEQVQTIEHWNELIDGYAEASVSAKLQEASIKLVSVYSTPKQEKSNVYSLSGYIGELTFSGVDIFLIPVIKMMGTMGVGNDVSFGLGFLSVKI